MTSHAQPHRPPDSWVILHVPGGGTTIHRVLCEIANVQYVASCGSPGATASSGIQDGGGKDPQW